MAVKAKSVCVGVEVRHTNTDGTGQWLIARAKSVPRACAMLIDQIRDGTAQASLSTLEGFNRSCFRTGEEFPVVEVECRGHRTFHRTIREVVRIRFRHNREIPYLDFSHRTQ